VATETLYFRLFLHLSIYFLHDTVYFQLVNEVCMLHNVKNLPMFLLETEANYACAVVFTAQSVDRFLSPSAASNDENFCCK
jgi:hypothetical protein